MCPLRLAWQLVAAATAVMDGAFSADVMHESLRRSSLAEIAPGSVVNLELPLRASVADEATRTRLWPELLKMYKTYESYQQKTDRQLPVVLLSPR